MNLLNVLSCGLYHDHSVHNVDHLDHPSGGSPRPRKLNFFKRKSAEEPANAAVPTITGHDYRITCDDILPQRSQEMQTVTHTNTRSTFLPGDSDPMNYPVVVDGSLSPGFGLATSTHSNN
uniref:ARAD1C24706p n=1 Tax=Blastobotrys adeninivorans TaxID=409370 RepID=A0A060T6Z8_BLAAD